MKPIIKIVVCCVLPMTLLTQCHTEKDCPECMTPPPDVIFQLISKTDASDLINSGVMNASDIQLYYKDSARDSTFVDTEVGSNEGKNYINATYMAWQSANGIKTFYLRLSPTDTDTIYIDVTEEKDECCTFFKQKAFEYNQVELKATEGIYQIRK